MADIQKKYFCLIREEEMLWGTCLEYEGDEEGLLAAGVGYPALFRVGKSGKKSVQRGLGETDSFIVECLKTKWRVTIYRQKPELLAAPGVWLLDKSVDDDGIETTWYAGTKKAIVAAGLAPVSMFRVGKSGQRWNTRPYVPVEERFTVRRYPDHWEVMLFRQIEAEKPDLEETTNEVPTHIAQPHKLTERRGVVIPFPGVQL